MLVKYERVEKSRIKTRSKPQARQKYDQAELVGLAESLAAGQLQPIGLLSDNTLIWGERRLRAALLKAEITHLWAAVFEKEITESQFLVMRAEENFQRADLTPYEKWQTCKELLEANPQLQMVGLARAIHLDPSMMPRLLSPSKCIAEWQEALKAENVGISDCYMASSLDEAGQRELLALKLSGASRDEIAARSRKARSGKPPATEGASRIKCPVPGKGATVQITGDSSMSLEEMITVTQEWIKRAKRACEMGWDCKTLKRACKDEAKKV